MKNLILFLVLVLSFTKISAQSVSEKSPDGLTWFSNMTEAQAISNQSNKPIFAFFTGSDWCGWCHKLQREVFAKPEFIAWAKKNVVLLELDFPRRKQLSPELTQQNASLQQEFKVSGYPTVWMFFLSKGNTENTYTINPLGSLGYPSNAEKGKEEVAFLKTANEILAVKKPK